ncbi:hypothetical protein [Streptomyces sparsus]
MTGTDTGAGGSTGGGADADADAGVGADATMAAIGRGVELGQRGERAAAREALAALWETVSVADNALHRCALAHAMADVQDDLREELRWDRRALRAAGAVTDEQARQAGAPGPVAAFYPSLHLNLAEVHRKLGELEQARHHVRCGTAAAEALGDDGYGRMIRGGLLRLEARLAEDHPA